MQLDKLVTLQRRGEHQDDAGQPKETWHKIDETWASIRPLSSREFFAASGTRGEITHQIIFRHGHKLQARDRILYDSRIFEVIGPPINLREQNRYMKAMGKERANNGI